MMNLEKILGFRGRSEDPIGSDSTKKSGRNHAKHSNSETFQVSHGF